MCISAVCLETREEMNRITSWSVSRGDYNVITSWSVYNLLVCLLQQQLGPRQQRALGILSGETKQNCGLVYAWSYCLFCVAFDAVTLLCGSVFY